VPTFRLKWNRHSERQREQRTALAADEILHYVAVGAAVLSRTEPNGIEERVIFSPRDKECFALIIDRGGTVITIMPILWRKLAPAFIDEARQLYTEKIEEAAA
jgi:hypothetical protein